MGKTTLRDEVWMYVVARAVKQGKSVRPEDVVESTAASERMVRQALLSILNSGLIERRADPNGDVRYVPSSHIEWTVEE